MFVDQLWLHNFRNYAAVDIELTPGVTIFNGLNGQGKTNLVEAIEYISTLGSHRVSSDAPLIKSGESQAIVRAGVQAGIDDDRRLLLELEINNGPNRARINRGSLPKVTDLMGALRTVMFAPGDLDIVRGEPAGRRRFIDQLVISRWPRMLGVKQDYDKVLRQRNALLKQISSGELDETAEFTLQVWDDSLVSFGAELLAARLDTLTELGEPAREAYASIAPINNIASAQYESSFPLPADGESLEDAFRDALHDCSREEKRRGVTLVGPHRDDIVLSIGELSARGYASHGESWSLALSLRLAAFSLLRSDGIEAVLILDDVFAELDETRRERLADAVVDAEQLLITAAVKSDIPPQLDGTWFKVEQGTVRRDDA